MLSLWIRSVRLNRDHDIWLLSQEELYQQVWYWHQAAPNDSVHKPQQHAGVWRVVLTAQVDLSPAQALFKLSLLGFGCKSVSGTICQLDSVTQGEEKWLKTKVTHASNHEFFYWHEIHRRLSEAFIWNVCLININYELCMIYRVCSGFLNNFLIAAFSSRKGERTHLPFDTFNRSYF